MTLTPTGLLGGAIAGIFDTLRIVRRPRPIHPHGIALRGTLRWLTDRAPAGIDFIDHPHTSELPVTARISRSVGVPSPLPDVIGLALRFETTNRPADVLFASTGFGVPSRFWLAAHRSPSRARLTTLMPLRTPNGPILLAARTLEPEDLPTDPDELARALDETSWRLKLYHAQPLGLWHPFAIVELWREPGAVDTAERYDPVRHPLPGTSTYAWERRLREPSYLRVQRRSQRESR
ncbi:hypothetical protein [Mycetocola zhadangensis]|uniref:Phosphodiesterase n=1 Tax=Mycetocola zhadangensis TaxID=1164595 RepID=A0A3L7J710_9MICO|nr:hypothetical protein [Mycetocola zhadangensis]RLQ86330.1 hypothetical protein D9V28_05780 [Mycetocola zhadangensis]GGE90235.1 hypothetical protein GCM10011313_11410 [Mycetocola zhadangensis]